MSPKEIDLFLKVVSNPNRKYWMRAELLNMQPFKRQCGGKFRPEVAVKLTRIMHASGWVKRSRRMRVAPSDGFLADVWYQRVGTGQECAPGPPGTFLEPVEEVASEVTPVLPVGEPGFLKMLRAASWVPGDRWEDLGGVFKLGCQVGREGTMAWARVMEVVGVELGNLVVAEHTPVEDAPWQGAMADKIELRRVVAALSGAIEALDLEEARHGDSDGGPRGDEVGPETFGGQDAGEGDADGGDDAGGDHCA